MPERLTPNPERLEPLVLSHDAQILVGAVLAIGPDIVSGRSASLEVRHKADQTPVSDVDEATNAKFNAIIDVEFAGRARVIGEEISQEPRQPPRFGEDQIIVTIDSVDGTLDHVAIHRDRNSGQLLDPTEPIPLEADPVFIQDHERSCCAGTALFINGHLRAAAVLNPFTNQLVVADRTMGGAFLVPPPDVAAGTITHGQRLSVSDQPFEPQSTPWDCAVWPDTPFDLQFLTKIAGQPHNRYSAISQAMDVALGKSVGVIFAGDTPWDVAPSAAIVLLAGGVVVKPDGRRITLDNLQANLIDSYPSYDIPEPGFVYTNQAAHNDFMLAFNADRETHPMLTAANGWLFSPTTHLYKPVRTIDGLVDFEHTADGQIRRDLITIGGFSIFGRKLFTRQDFKEVRQQTRQYGGSRLRYRRHSLDGPEIPVRYVNVRVRHPDRQVEIEPGMTIPTADFALAALRSRVAYNLHKMRQKP